MTYPAFSLTENVGWRFTEGASGLSHSFPVPNTSATAGSLLLAVIGAGTEREFTGWTSGWEILYSEAAASLAGNTILLAKKAVGGETELSVTSSGNTKANAIIFEITGWQGDDSASFANSLIWGVAEHPISTTVPNPPSIDTTAVRDYLCLAVVAVPGPNTGTIVADGNFTEVKTHLDATSAGASLSAWYRQFAGGAALDPVAFSGFVTARDAVAFTIAVLPEVSSGRAPYLGGLSGGMIEMNGNLGG
ncbi:MAG: hypothetical protein MUD05_04750 [Candidatus Nanopelagicales bacterium]|jgi:hypothetical protein|nr:hypothetical protein [Candidatus Nanopelagicales bacterium]